MEFQPCIKERSGDDKGIVEGKIKIRSVVLKLSSSGVSQGVNIRTRNSGRNGVPLLLKLPAPTPHFKQSSSPEVCTMGFCSEGRFIKPLD